MQWWWRRQLVLVPIALVVATVGAVVWSNTVADDEPDIVLSDPGEFLDPSVTNVDHDGDPWPAFDLVDADGADVRLAPDGRPMVVNLWYSTCPPCSRELAAFGVVEDEFAGDVRFVGVNPNDDAETMVEYAGDRGVDYELLRDLDNTVADELGILQFPVTLFVSADGEIVRQTGVLSESALRDHVSELVA